MKKRLFGLIGAMLIGAAAVSGCVTAPQMAAPTELVAPTPIADNSGQFMSPFTEDGTVAPWVEKGRAASVGSAVGSYLGAKAGEQLAASIPFIGGFLGQAAGKALGRQAALAIVGGEDYIRSTSDQSFNSIDDLAVYMYVKNSGHKDYAEVLHLTQEIYPDLKARYIPAIIGAQHVAASN